MPKLLVISHACIIPVNQSFYADVENLGWQVELVIPSSWNSEYSEDVTIQRWRNFKGPIHGIPVWKPGSIPLHAYKQILIGLLKKVRPDAIYVHHEPYGVATAQVFLANRLVDRRPIGFYGAQNILKTYPFPFRWLERYVLKHADFAFPVTEGALNVLRKKGYRGTVEVLPLAVDRALYYPRRAWSVEHRKELGVQPDEIVFGYLGRFVEEKGLQSMLRAAGMLTSRKWRCFFVGSGPYQPAMEALAVDLGIADHVRFVGFVPHEEAPKWLSLFDVLVLASESRPNWKEQFGRVIVEGNACETAVIGTESGEIGNVLRETGGGVIVPENDVGALASAMLDLVDHPDRIRELAHRGAEAVERKYDQRYLASRFVATIQRCLDRA